MRWLMLISLVGQYFLLGVFPQQEIVIANINTEYVFNQALTIQADVNLAQPVEKAQLNLQTEAGEINQVEFAQSSASQIQLQIDLTQLNLPPFSRVYYWFVFLFQDGSSYTSPSYWFDYSDNRFQWESTTSKWFNIFWVQPELSAESLQSLSLDGLKKATTVLPVSPKLPISIYLYPDAASLQHALGNSTSHLLAGRALLKNNVILVSSSDDLTNSTNLERQIPHELTHLIEYQISGDNYTSVPAWLLEGLATNAENYQSTDQARALKSAVQKQTLIPLEQLCVSLPDDPALTTLAYAESASFTKFLSERYGTDKIMNLLKNAGNGLSCQQLVENTLGDSLADLENTWKSESLLASTRGVNLVSYWPVLPVIGLILIPLILIRKHQKSKNASGGSNA